MIDQLLNLFSVTKTERFILLPIAQTEENFNNKLLLETDKRRAESYKKVKKIMDEYHKFFIESVLCNFKLEGIEAYSELYFKSNKTDKDTVELEKSEAKMRKAISTALKKDPRYKNLNKKEFVREILPDYLTDESEKEIVSEFYDFTTYFTGFWKNRENMYTDENQPTAVSYRCINDNLPKFLDNVKSFLKVKASLPQDDIDYLNAVFKGLYDTTVEEVFSVDYFSFVLAQSGIDRYNEIIGGYSTSDGQKTKGVNECINLYNQKVAKFDKSKRLPLLKPLFKQILSDRESISFIPEDFKDDTELLVSIKKFFDGTDEHKSFIKSLNEYVNLFTAFSAFNMDGVHICAGSAVTDISNAVFNSWSVIKDNWNIEYEQLHKKPKTEKEDAYYEKEREAFKKIKSFSISEIQRLGNGEKSVSEYIKDGTLKLISSIKENYLIISDFLSKPYSESKRLSANDSRIQEIKALLDSVKDFEKFVKPLCGSGKEEEKDNAFYGAFLPLFEETTAIDTLYNRVRNYLTKKPYSNEKIKLNFDNPQFLGGWSFALETARSSFFLREKNYYYLAVMDYSHRPKFQSIPKPQNNDDRIEKMVYYQAADPSRAIPNLMVIDGKTVKKNGKQDDDKENRLLEKLRSTYLPENINRIRVSRSFSKLSDNFCRQDLSDYIEYYQIRVKEYFKELVFNFKSPEEYDSFAAFTDHVNSQAYQIKFENVSRKFIYDCVENGSLYLFQIYNKDFSEYSKGKPNLHTLYFKMLFDERNLADVVYKLNGQAEMFYREASIKDSEKVVHPANQPVNNKNPDNKKKTSTFKYDIIKDRRYTKRQFSLHLPITMNFKANGDTFINNAVREELKKSVGTHVIGIDRGERNLIYITVVDPDGKIVEQKSLNEIIGDNGYKVNYHTLLDSKEADRDKARKDWKTISGIKELKEGYLSQVIHEICKLVVKYDAIIAMEDLNSGFMNSRKKVEKQVYQKFEKMLTDKLNYLVEKDKDVNEPGGLLKAYQLTNKADKSRKGIQDGIIFYIPAWLTSKIDPTTGFVNLLNTKYTNVPASVEFIKAFDDISYNSATDMFEFKIDYSKFPRCQADFRKKWTICTNGERIKTFCNADKNSEWDNKIVSLTTEFKNLFNSFNIDYSANLKEQIVSQTDKAFFKSFMELLSLTLQMRNSITGNTDVDYLISPVRNADGKFYDSRDYKDVKNAPMPSDADANGAYNIARKGLWAIGQIKAADDVSKVKLSISNKEWLEFAQKK